MADAFEALWSKELTAIFIPWQPCTTSTFRHFTQCHQNDYTMRRVRGMNISNEIREREYTIKHLAADHWGSLPSHSWYSTPRAWRQGPPVSQPSWRKTRRCSGPQWLSTKAPGRLLSYVSGSGCVKNIAPSILWCCLHSSVYVNVSRNN